MITESKEIALQGLLKGEDKTDIAKKAGVNRKSIYNWLHDDEFVKELEARRKDIAKSGNDFVLAKVQSYLDQLDDLAIRSNDARTKASVLMYLVDRALGKTASRLELEPIEPVKVPSREDLEKEFKECRLDASIDCGNPDDDV